MKKVLLAGAALMMVGNIAASASAAAVEPGVKITGDARARLWYKSEEYSSRWGNFDGYDSQTNLDSRVRFNFVGTAAGGAYAKARIRLMESTMSDLDKDLGERTDLKGDNIWADMAYLGVPFTDEFTLEIGKYRSTYGPLGSTYNFFYDDVNLAGARGIVKLGDIEINPFIEWMEDGQNLSGVDKKEDNDEIRYGAHIKGKINKDWTVGAMVAYQTDDRDEDDAAPSGKLDNINNEGFFGSLYTKGKSGQFGLAAELGITDGDLNGFNTYSSDDYYDTSYTDVIGSNDTGYGGYIFPNFQIDKLNIGLNLGMTDGGFRPDTAFGFVMLGAGDNSIISAQTIGDTGDWLWAGLVAEYAINESLKLTGNLVYADVDAWTEAGDGPGFTGADNSIALENAWEISAVLQYTISKGMDVFFAAGYLDPSLEYVNQTSSASPLDDDAAFGAYTRFELKF